MWRTRQKSRDVFTTKWMSCDIFLHCKPKGESRGRCRENLIGAVSLVTVYTRVCYFCRASNFFVFTCSNSLLAASLLLGNVIVPLLDLLVIRHVPVSWYPLFMNPPFGVKEEKFPSSSVVGKWGFWLSDLGNFQNLDNFHFWT